MRTRPLRLLRTMRRLAPVVAIFAVCEIKSQPAPNILYLLADQWRASATGYAGDPNVRTPNLDRLSEESLNFGNAVSVLPVCTPHRAALMTGRYPTSTGMFLNDAHLPDEELCLAEIFGAAGYATAYIGKWHLDGHGRQSYIPPERRQGWQHWKAAECDHDYNHSHYYSGDSDVKRYWEGYDAFAQTRDAQQYLRDHAGAGRPFVLMVAYGTPHFPHATAPAEFKALYPPENIQLPSNVSPALQARARQEAQGYYAHCTALDQCIGDLLHTLAETGLSTNTIVVFSSDHGEMLGSQGVNPTQKQVAWSESAQVPFLLRVPGLGGRKVTTPITTPDVLPTLLGLSDVPVPGTVEGEDLSPLLRSGRDEDRAALYMSVSPFTRGVSPDKSREYRAIRTSRYTYARSLDGPWLLFDDTEDPFQTDNLVEEAGHTALVKELDARLQAELQRIGDDFRPGGDYITEWGYELGAHGSVPYAATATNVQTPRRIPKAEPAVVPTKSAVGESSMTNGTREAPLRVWFDHPATDWERETLPLGNGRLGATVFGGVEQERITINEQSLWSGWPEPRNDRPGSFEALQKVRALLRDGRREEAGKLAMVEFMSEKGYGKPDFGCYQAFCDLLLDFAEPAQPVEDYRRELDLDTAIARVSYRVGSTEFQREVFCSYPDQAMALRLSGSTKGAINFRLGLTTPHADSSVVVRDHGLILSGQVATPEGSPAGMKFEARVIVRSEGGELKAEGDGLVLKDADAATVLLVGATNYKLEYPRYLGSPPDMHNRATLASLQDKSWTQLREAHVTDYQRLFRRVALELEGPSESVLPTDQRLARYRKSRDDRGLEVLLFQYGRYLLISSSRPGGLPANLQGLWNNSTKPPWNCDYHLNINLQMNYWPAGPANLAECAEPLMDWLDDLRKPGAQTARIHYNSRGWVVHHVANVWGFTSPGPARGIHMMEAEGAAWICQNVWDHFAFTQDREFLARTGWPILKGAAEFWVDNLQELPDGRLTVSPAYSPEHGPLTQGTFYAIQLVEDLFHNCIEAGGVLGRDREFCERLQGLRERLVPLQVGEHGQLCEWIDADLEANVRKDKHRHHSHLFALHPGRQTTPAGTPELAAAARQSLDYRGDGGTGWAVAWRMNFFARLKDGTRAWDQLSNLLAVRMLPNLWDSCPPFQIDGNFGATAGVAEMLLQSHAGEIELLPALPRSWPTGSVKGLRARGGFTVDLAWQDGRVTDYRIASVEPREVTVLVNDEVKSVTAETL